MNVGKTKGNYTLATTPEGIVDSLLVFSAPPNSRPDTKKPVTAIKK